MAMAMAMEVGDIMEEATREDTMEEDIQCMEVASRCTGGGDTAAGGGNPGDPGAHGDTADGNELRSSDM